MNKFERFIKDEEGVTAIEYGLIAAAMGLMLVVAAPPLAKAIQGTFQKTGSALTGYNPTFTS